MIKNTFAAQGKQKPDTERKRNLNLAALKLTAVQVTELSL
jgi:hypothetical protein